MNRVCGRCKIDKPLEAFSKDSTRKLGHDYDCKQCKRAYYELNKAKFIAKAKKWNKANPEKIRRKNAIWQAKNKERCAVLSRRWAQKNKIKVRVRGHNYRARKNGNGGRHTDTEVIRLMALQKGKCAICRSGIRRKFEKDHIQPISAGGSNDIKNIQLTCRSCNRSRWAKDSLTFMRERGMLL
jgi:5-methylcytosine-specific restriction endonuclease McrA